MAAGYLLAHVGSAIYVTVKHDGYGAVHVLLGDVGPAACALGVHCHAHAGVAVLVEIGLGISYSLTAQ